jgi:hypothetical protein
LFLAGKLNPKPKKEVRSVILSHRFWRGYELEKGSVVCNSIIVFGGEGNWKKEVSSGNLSQDCIIFYCTCSLTLFLRTVFKKNYEKVVTQPQTL